MNARSFAGLDYIMNFSLRYLQTAYKTASDNTSLLLSQ